MTNNYFRVSDRNLINGHHRLRSVFGFDEDSSDETHFAFERASIAADRLRANGCVDVRVVMYRRVDRAGPWQRVPAVGEVADDEAA